MDLKHAKILIILLLSFLLFFSLAKKIDFTTADLGRHLKNGEILLFSPINEKINLLYTNYYSFSSSDHSFINHHWLSGIIFFLLWKIIGFPGLSLFFIILSFLSFFLFWDIARRRSNFFVASFFALLVIPLIASRAEIRPEIFTYFFLAVFFWLLESKKKLWLLPLLMLFWVNLHIGFILGLFIIASFCFYEFIKLIRQKENDFKKLFLVLISCFAVSFINPFGFRAVFYPFFIFRNYGYLVVENQSIGFLENIGFKEGMHFLLFKMIVLLGIILSIFSAYKKKFDFNHFAILFSFASLAYSGIRHFPLLALVSIPILSSEFKKIEIKNEKTKKIIPFFALILTALSLGNQLVFLNEIKPIIGLGLSDKVNASADFFKENNLKGPIFNNYDIGSFLIFFLENKEKVFVDNRPEAYSEDFFKKIYIPAEENEESWKKLDDQYNFNVIFFSHRDYTPWGQQFLISRLKDNDWTPVFVDNFNIIFLKNNEKNRDIINKFKISKEFFEIQKN